MNVSKLSIYIYLAMLMEYVEYFVVNLIEISTWLFVDVHFFEKQPKFTESYLTITICIKLLHQIV